MSARSKLQQVEGEDRAGLDTSDVAESTTDLQSINFGVVDDERTSTLAVAATTKFTLHQTAYQHHVQIVYEIVRSLITRYKRKEIL